MSEHLGRALRPVVIEIPLKAGVKFNTTLQKFADEDGELLLKVYLTSLFDFDVTLTIDDYGTLGKLIDVLTEAQVAELERIKGKSKAARGERTRSQSAVREPTTPNPGVPEKGPRGPNPGTGGERSRRKKRRTRNAGPR